MSASVSPATTAAGGSVIAWRSTIRTGSSRLAVLDIVPTRTIFRATNQAIATGYFHWFFLIQPYGLPEHLIGADPDFYLHWVLGRWGSRARRLRPRRRSRSTSAALGTRR